MLLPITPELELSIQQLLYLSGFKVAGMWLLGLPDCPDCFFLCRLLRTALSGPAKKSLQLHRWRSVIQAYCLLILPK